MHAPMQVPDKYIRKIGGDAENPSERTIYLGMLAPLDDAIGVIVDTLKETGQFEKTLIVFTTDNGGSVSHSASNLPLRGTKGTLWEGGTRGVAFLKHPLSLQNHPEARISDGLFHITDWYPTLAKIAGIDDKKILHLDGVDQRQLLFNGGPSGRNDFVYNLKTVPFRAGYRMG